MILMQHGALILPLLPLMSMTIAGDGIIGTIGMAQDGVGVGIHGTAEAGDGMLAGDGTIGMVRDGAGDGTIGTVRDGDMVGMEMDGIMDCMGITMPIIVEEEPVDITEIEIHKEDITVELLTQQVVDHLQEIILVQEQEVLQPVAVNFLREIQVERENIILIMLEQEIILQM